MAEPGVLIHYELLTALIAVVGAVSTGVVLMLRSIFVTKKQLDKHEADCQGRVCKKVDGINSQMEEMEKKRDDAKDEGHKKDLWLAETLTRIADKVGADIEPMPK